MKLAILFILPFYFWSCHVACGVLVPDQRVEPRTTTIKCLTTGPLGSSPKLSILQGQFSGT